MSKSLAERIGDHTRKVMGMSKEEQIEKNRAKNKEMILDALKNDIKTRVNIEVPLFWNEEKTEIRFGIDSLCGPGMHDNIMDILVALKDIGFEVYYDYSLSRIRAIIPQHNVSDVILNLVDMYNTNLIRFKESEAEKARQDTETVIKMLEQEQYDVLDINRVRVSISSQSETLYYLECISNILSENNLCVDLLVCDEYWEISIPEGSD